MDERLRKSYLLVPWRGLKVVLRAYGAGNAPPEVATLFGTMAATQLEAANPAEAAKQILSLAYALHRARSALSHHDEDEYPLLWTAWLKLPPPLPWYDARVEHLTTALALETLGAADRQNATPLPEISFYELSRASASADWPWPLRQAAQLDRGMAFCDAGYHYAAEEEITRYLADLERASAADLDNLGTTLRRSSEDGRDIARAAGHFFRAWNRFGLGRERSAEEDLAAGLDALDRAKIENELTLWARAFLAIRHQQPAQAADALDKLAKSPYLSVEVRNEIQEAADGIRQGKPNSTIGQARAVAIVVPALIARAGGLESILCTLIGEKHGRQVSAKLAWLSRIRSGFGAVDKESLERGAVDLASRGRGAAEHGFNAIKDRFHRSPEHDGGQ